MRTDTCEACGAVLTVGAFPFCPHGASTAGRAPDVTWPGGRTFENLGDQPVTFYSPAEKARYLKAHNLEEFVRHVPVPGSDKSPHTTSWAGVSQHTLDAARQMLERIGQAHEPAPRTYIESMTVTMTDEDGTVWAPRGTFDAA